MKKITLTCIGIPVILVLITLFLKVFSGSKLGISDFLIVVFNIPIILSVLFISKFYATVHIKGWKNLAPQLVRQRCIIELNTDHLVKEKEITDYLEKLSEILEMKVLQPPFSYPAVIADYYVGDGGWIHWSTSGAHAYSYIKEWTKNGKFFFTVDAYTCKPFSIEKAYEFTREYFGVSEDNISYKDVEI